MAEQQTIFAGIFPKQLLDTIKVQLTGREETIAVAESVTSGLLQLAFGTVESASSFYQGGITAYNLGQKYRHLSVEPIHAMACDCISQHVANQMALNVCTLFNSDWGLGITGYATSNEQSNELFAYCSIACKGDIVVAEKLVPKHTEPSAVQVEYAQQLLQHLGRHLASLKS